MTYTYPLRVPPGEHLDDEHAENIADYVDKMAKKQNHAELKPRQILQLLSRQHPDKFAYKKNEHSFKSYRVHRLHHVVHHLQKKGWKKEQRVVNDKKVTVFVR